MRAKSTLNTNVGRKEATYEHGMRLAECDGPLPEHIYTVFIANLRRGIPCGIIVIHPHPRLCSGGETCVCTVIPLYKE